MKIDKTFIENKLAHSKDDPTIWIILSTEYKYELIVPNLDGKPSPSAIDYLVEMLENIEQVILESQSFIRHHLSVKSEFSLQGIEVLDKPDKHNATATLHFWCEEDGYLFTEIGLIEFRPRYLLIKYW